MTEHVLLSGDRGAILKASFAAYKRAAKRHANLVAMPGGGEASIYVSLGEALFWAVAIDEMLAARDAAYRQRRDRDPRAEFFPGLKLARNQLTHAVDRLGLARRQPAPSVRPPCGTGAARRVRAAPPGTPHLRDPRPGEAVVQ